MKDTMATMTSSKILLFFIMKSVLGRIPHGISCHVTNYDSRNDVQTQSAMAKDGPFIPPAAMPRNRSTLPASYAKLLPPHTATLSLVDKSLKDNEIHFVFSIFTYFFKVCLNQEQQLIYRRPACQSRFKIFPVPEDLS